MRKLLLVLGFVVFAGFGAVGYRHYLISQIPFNSIPDCTRNQISDTTIRSLTDIGIEPWPGTPLDLDTIFDQTEVVSATTMRDGSMLVAVRFGEIYEIDQTGSSELLWIEPEIFAGQPELGVLHVLADLDRQLIFTSVTRSDWTLEVRARPLDNPDPHDYGSVIALEQPWHTHNGGKLVPTPDGYMFLTLGDGGPSGDEHGHPQNLDTLYGSILRIDPSADGYTIPADNPAGPDGQPGPHWAYGLRNPWQISVDPATGTLWIADVGNSCIEEVSVMPAVGVSEPWNFGWSAFEGSSRGKGEIPDNHVPPITEYTKTEIPGVCSVIGGHVYRGEAIPDLQGMYVFADYCLGTIWALDVANGDVGAVYDLGVRLDFVTSIAVTHDEEFWVLSQTRGVAALVPTS